MCGRYTYKLTWREIVELYRLTLPEEPPAELRPNYNVAPTLSRLWSPVEGGGKAHPSDWFGIVFPSAHKNAAGIILPSHLVERVAGRFPGCNSPAAVLEQQKDFRSIFRRRVHRLPHRGHRLDGRTGVRFKEFAR